MGERRGVYHFTRNASLSVWAMNLILERRCTRKTRGGEATGRQSSAHVLRPDGWPIDARAACRGGSTSAEIGQREPGFQVRRARNGAARAKGSAGWEHQILRGFADARWALGSQFGVSESGSAFWARFPIVGGAGRRARIGVSDTLPGLRGAVRGFADGGGAYDGRSTGCAVRSLPESGFRIRDKASFGQSGRRCRGGEALNLEGNRLLAGRSRGQTRFGVGQALSPSAVKTGF